MSKEMTRCYLELRHAIACWHCFTVNSYHVVGSNRSEQILKITLSGTLLMRTEYHRFYCLESKVKIKSFLCSIKNRATSGCGTGGLPPPLLNVFTRWKGVNGFTLPPTTSRLAALRSWTEGSGEQYGRINSIKSPASGVGNVSEPRLVSRVGRLGKFWFAYVGVFVHSGRWW
jgi:hypothetical protein